MPKSLAPQQKKHSVYSLFAGEVFKFPVLLSISVVGMVLMPVAELSAPLYLKQFFNTLVTDSPDTALVHKLAILLGFIAFFYLLDWIAARLLYFTLMEHESRVIENLYKRSFSYLVDHSYQFFSSQFSGTLTRRVSKFSNAFEHMYDAITMQFIPTAIFVGGAVVILFIRNHVLGTALAIWAVFFVAFQILVARWQRPLRQASSAEDSRLTGGVADAISNQNTIMLFAGNIFERNRFAESVRRWRKVTLKSWYSNEYIWAVLSLFVLCINIGLLAGALYFWQRGELTVGDFVLIQAYLLTTIQQLMGINRNLRRYYDSHAEAQEMVDILNTPHEVQDVAGAKPIQVDKGVVSFHDVSFHFHEERPVLRRLSLTINAGEKIALVGPSGAGKSTITRLLLRFYDAKSGRIEIDDQDITKVQQNSLRDSIAFVPQEPILFHRSLMENIRYGRRDASDEEVIEAAKQAHCHEFIQSLPQGYETYVGERGVKLSGGERQRVAIARAILKNAPILVLDEATSSLDSESESLIQDALKTLMKGKTVIVIAHRLSTIMSMDRILVLENGVIVADGTHDELVNHEGGLYHKLWSIQAGGFMVDTDA